MAIFDNNSPPASGTLDTDLSLASFTGCHFVFWSKYITPHESSGLLDMLIKLSMRTWQTDILPYQTQHDRLIDLLIKLNMTT